MSDRFVAIPEFTGHHHPSDETCTWYECISARNLAAATLRAETAEQALASAAANDVALRAALAEQVAEFDKRMRSWADLGDDVIADIATQHHGARMDRARAALSSPQPGAALLEAVRGKLPNLEMLARNGRWGTCVDCPRERGLPVPEKCAHFGRYDHKLEVAQLIGPLVAALKQWVGA